MFQGQDLRGVEWEVASDPEAPGFCVVPNLLGPLALGLQGASPPTPPAPSFPPLWCKAKLELPKEGFFFKAETVARGLATGQSCLLSLHLVISSGLRDREPQGSGLILISCSSVLIRLEGG